MSSARRTKSYKYDAALSFAGEDRAHAEALSRQLRRVGLSVFYDAEHQARLWGRSAREFDDVYGPQSRFVIPFISKHYVSKDWPRYEFETAKREERRRRGEFILPIRVDDSRMLGLRDDVITLDVRRHNAKHVAALFAAKCRPHRQTVDRAPIPPLRRHARLLVDVRLRRCLGLLARAVLPLAPEVLAKLFPAYDWRRIVPRLVRAGLVRRRTYGVEVDDLVVRMFRSDRTEWNALNDAWIARLQELAEHYDIAALLAVHLVAARRLPQAARAVVDVAQGTNVGDWNAIYVVLLGAFSSPRVLSKLDSQTQVEVINSYGRCLLDAGRHAEASRTFARLHALSRRLANPWGVGQALVHAGLAAHSLGDDLRSQRFYERCAAHARRTRDAFLLGRALNNLSLLQLDKNVDRAEQLLNASLAAKRRARDARGIVAALGTRGNIAAARHQYSKAVRLYAAAAAAARRAGMRHELALSSYNLGRAYQDLGRTSAATARYETALRISEEDGFLDVLILALNALAIQAFDSGHYGRCALLGQRLATAGSRGADAEHHLSGLHMRACSLRAMGRAGGRVFMAALRTARAAAKPDWIVRCLVDRSRFRSKGRLGLPNLANVRQQARREGANGHASVAAQLWRVVADLEARTDGAGNVSVAFREADRQFAAARTSRGERVELLRAWYGWAWSSGRHQEAIGALRSMERTATALRDIDTAIAALDQRAHCWQDLGRPQRAEPLHREAVRLARRYRRTEQLDRSLNNLGEALRRLERPEEALSALAESERIARRSGRHEDALLVVRNRALSLLDLRRYDEAKRLLLRARREAQDRRHWKQYPRIAGALANVAWHRGQGAEAARLYQQAVRSARSHQHKDEELELVLNLAKVLKWEGRSRAALAVLRRYETAAAGHSQQGEVLRTVAELLETLGRLKEAQGVWGRARRAAARAGDGIAEQTYLAEEARLRNRVKSLARPDSWYTKSIRREGNVEQRRRLMLERLRALIARRTTSTAAQRVFEESLAYCEEHGLHHLKSQFYALVGDSQLAGSESERLTACRAYVMAMVTVLAKDLRLMPAVSAHVFHSLASPESQLTPAAVPGLVDRLIASLADEFKGVSVKMRALVLWPFLEAKRLAPMRTSPDAFLEALGTVGGPSYFEDLSAKLAGPDSHRSHRAPAGGR